MLSERTRGLSVKGSIFGSWTGKKGLPGGSFLTYLSYRPVSFLFQVTQIENKDKTPGLKARSSGQNGFGPIPLQTSLVGLVAAI